MSKIIKHKKFSTLKLPSVKTAIIVLGLAIPVLILSQIVELFLLMIFTIALTLIFIPAVDYFENKGMKRFTSALTVYGCIAIGLTLFLLVFIPVFTSQIGEMSAKLQKVSIDDKLHQVETFIHPYLPKVKLSNAKPKIVSAFEKMETKLKLQYSIVTQTAGVLLFLPLLVFFGIKDFPTIKKRFASSVPNKYFEMSLNFIFRIERQLSKYMRGIFLQNFVVGFTAGLGYFIIGLDYSFILGLLIAVFNIVPILGPIVGGVLPILVAIVQYNTADKLIAPIVVIVISQIVNWLMRRIVLRQMLKLSPVVIILVVALGNELMGAIGTILFIPVYTVLAATAKETYRELKSYKICAVE